MKIKLNRTVALNEDEIAALRDRYKEAQKLSPSDETFHQYVRSNLETCAGAWLADVVAQYYEEREND